MITTKKQYSPLDMINFVAFNKFEAELVHGQTLEKRLEIFNKWKKDCMIK